MLTPIVLQVQRGEVYDEVFSAAQYFGDWHLVILETHCGLATLCSCLARVMGERGHADTCAKFDLANNKNPLKQCMAHMELGSVISASNIKAEPGK